MSITVAVSVEFAASLRRVWEAVADLGSHSEWMADAASIDFIGDQHAGVGTRLVVATRIGPFRTHDVIEVVTWEEPHRIGVRHLEVIGGEGEFRLATVAGGTRLIWTEHLRFPLRLGGRVTELLARLVLAWVFRRDLRRLRGIVESRVRSEPAD